MFLPLHDTNPIRHIPFPYVNYTLIGLNLVMFLYQMALPPPGFDQTAIVLGLIPAVVNDAVAPPIAGFPEQVTFITYAFLHADWLHLLSNMLFLWIFGDNIEDALGHVRYPLFYLACAVLAGWAHVLMNAGSYGPLIGASGAVAGVMGAYILLYPHARVYVLFRIVIPIPLPLPAIWMLGAWLAMQLFYAVAAPNEPVSWWAHIGGMAAGAALVTVMKRQQVPLWGGR